MRIAIGAALALALGVFLASPAEAAAADEAGGAVGALASKPAQGAQPAHGLRADIDALLQKLETATGGVVTWDGAGQFDVRRDGNAEVADIADARITIHLAHVMRAELALDRIEVRRVPGPDNLTALDIKLPGKWMLRAETGDETKLALQDGTARVVLDMATGRARETSVAVARMRVDDKKTGDWISFGPLSFSSKLAAAGAGWSQPIDFTVQHVGFMFNGGPAGGTIDRIAYGGRADGPDLAALNRLRDEIDAVNRKTVLTPDQQGQAFAALLPQLLSAFSEAKGELTIEGVAVRGVDDQSLVSFTEASLGGSLTRMPGDAEAVRVTLKENGLSLAPKLAGPSTVPRRAELDIGLEDIAIAPLRALVEASGKLRADSGGPADRQRAMQTLIGAVSKLNPRWRVYDLTVDTADVGIEAKAEAQGSPLNLAQAKAEADVAVRGFAALPEFVGHAPAAQFLPLLAEIGTPGHAPDGSPRLDFHLVSTLTKWLTINGNDVSAWFATTHAAPGEPRSLRPAVPPMAGKDVSAVQRALAAAHFNVPQTGLYDGATALAIARFQKRKGLNLDGVADSATLRKLGVSPQPAEPNQP